MNEADATQHCVFSLLEPLTSAKSTAAQPHRKLHFPTWPHASLCENSLHSEYVHAAHITQTSKWESETRICKTSLHHTISKSPHERHIFPLQQFAYRNSLVFHSFLHQRYTRRLGSKLTDWGSFAGPAPKLMVRFCSMMKNWLVSSWLDVASVWISDANNCLLSPGCISALSCSLRCGKCCVQVLLVNSCSLLKKYSEVTL